QPLLQAPDPHATPRGTRNLDAVPFGEHLQSLPEAQLLVEHQKLEDVTAHAAAEAVEHLLLLVHVEGRGLLRVKRAKAGVSPARLSEGNVLAARPNDVCSRPYAINELSVPVTPASLMPPRPH